jgi:hypothetical protein
VANKRLCPVICYLFGRICAFLYFCSSMFRVQTIDNLVKLFFFGESVKQFLKVNSALWFENILGLVVSRKNHLNGPPCTAPSLVVIFEVVRHIEGMVTTLKPLINVQNLMIFDNGIVILWLFIDFLDFSQLSHVKEFPFKPTYAH